MKLYLFTLFVCCSIVTHGQFNRGDRVIGGSFSLGFSRGTNGGAKTTDASCGVHPSLSYFLNDKYAVGGGIGVFHRRAKTENELGDYLKDRSWSFNVNASLARYFVISEKFAIRLSGLVNYGRQQYKVEQSPNETKSKSHSIGLHLVPAMIFFPAPQWGIEASIGSLDLSHSRGLSTNYKNTSFGLDYGYVSLGFAYYLRSVSDSQ